MCKQIIIIIIITHCKFFFIPASSNGLSLEFKWQQISLGFQNSSQYSGRS